MPHKTNCSEAHEGKDPGPCVHCKQHDVSARYTHLYQKRRDPKSSDLVDFVQDSLGYPDDACICRKCVKKLTSLAQEHSSAKRRRIDTHEDKVEECLQPNSEPLATLYTATPVDFQCERSTGHCCLKTHLQCDDSITHQTSVEPFLFNSCFSADVIDESTGQLQVLLCRPHYHQYKRFERCLSTESSSCCICDTRYNRNGKFIHIPKEKTDKFLLYLNRYMDKDGSFQVHEQPVVCTSCYMPFYHLLKKSNEFEEDFSKSDDYLDKLLEGNKTETSTINSISFDLICFSVVLEHVVKEFKSNKALLLSQVYDMYLKELHTTVDRAASTSNIDLVKLRHDNRWLLKMLKCKLGPCLLTYVPNQKRYGNMLYRRGSDLFEVLYTSLVDNYRAQSQFAESTELLSTKVTTSIESMEECQNDTFCHLENALSSSVQCVKSYVSACIQAETVPNIHNFDLKQEILKIDPVLWNFIYRLTANEQEKKALRKSHFTWDQLYLGNDDTNLRLFPRLFIASCIFNTFNSHCIEPLHLLLSDIADKYSGSSSDLLSINARLGAGVSKDTLCRFISGRCKALQEQSRLIACKSFAVASFDNLDKNQSYAAVTQGKDKSGFHGTTIQVAFPKPSEENHVSELVGLEPTYLNRSDSSQVPGTSNVLSSSVLPIDEPTGDLVCSNSEVSKNPLPSLVTLEVEESFIKKSRSRSLSTDFVKSLKEPDNKVGEPSPANHSRFAHLSLDDFLDTDQETQAWELFTKRVCTFGFVKHFSLAAGVTLPSLKTYLALPAGQSTERSVFRSIAVLDETADNKDTVLKTLNILHDKFQIGSKLPYLVVVGDGKSYDHMIRLKSEYGSSLNWVLPYPGDWHILKNVLSIFMKIYYDAGLKDLAIKYHRGATLKALVGCTRFIVTHRFLHHIWESMYRLQIDYFLKSESGTCFDVSIFKQRFEEVFSNILSNIPDQACSWEDILLHKQEFEMAVDQENFDKWRLSCSSSSDTFKFWDTFVHVDFMSYLGLFLGIRGRDWDLRNTSLKKLTCLFYAFDRHNYMRMIPYHLADLCTFPSEVISHFRAGCFAASLSGSGFHSVALDEAHEMEINLKTKKAINSFSQSSLAMSTAYLPYRAETLQNLKAQLGLEKGDNQRRHETSPGFIAEEEKTIQSYMEQLKVSLLFKGNISENLLHIFSGVEASAVQSDSLMHFHQYGMDDMKRYVCCFLLKLSHLHGKLPLRRPRHLSTFSVPKQTVPKQKRVIQDNQLVIECLKKQIAFSRLTGKPVGDIDQFISHPRAICTSDDIPEKGIKSHAANVLKSWYGEAFLSSLPPAGSVDVIAVILEGMFMINTSPLQQQHRTFGDYGEFLFHRWIFRAYRTFNASQVHVIFDHPNRHGMSVKDIERRRRDTHLHDDHFTDSVITADSQLPTNWQSFVANRSNKRKLVNFLSHHFLYIAQRIFHDDRCHFITAGGFDDLCYIDVAVGALCSVEGGLITYPDMKGNHEEGDTRIWLHALKSGASRVILYSPDTDTLFIGLPFLKKFEGKQVYLQTKDSPYEKVYVDMFRLSSLISSDFAFTDMTDINHFLQMLYICSGCDFTSFFRGFGKKSFFECFRKNAQFISGDLCRDDIDGLCSFLRLICCVYFTKYRTAFQPFKSVQEMLGSIDGMDSSHDSYVSLICQIREKLWVRMTSEEKMLPNADALKLHWQRCCWVLLYWKQCLSNVMILSDFGSYGWKVRGNEIAVVWDTDDNLQQVEKNLQWYTKGCSCKSGCTTNRCSCRRHAGVNSGYCGPGCACQNCNNIPDNTNQDQLSMLDQSFDLSVYEQDLDEDLFTEDLDQSDVEEECDSDQVHSTDDGVEVSHYWNTFQDIIDSLI